MKARQPIEKRDAGGGCAAAANGLRRPRAGQEGKGGSAGSASASSVALGPVVPGGGAAEGRPPSTAPPIRGLHQATGSSCSAG